MVVRRDIVPFVRRVGPVIIGVMFLVLALSPAARVALFGEWGFHNLLQPHERAKVLNSGSLFEGEWFAYESGGEISPYFDTWVFFAKGPSMQMHERDERGVEAGHSLVEPDATGLYSVFSIDLPKLELELLFTLYEGTPSQLIHEEYLGEGVLVKMMARPLGGGR